MELDRTKRKLVTNWWMTIDRFFFYGVMILIMFGIALLMAASPPVAKDLGYSSFYFVKKQIFFIILGVSIILSLSAANITTIRRLSVLGFLGCFILLIAVELWGYETKGARRWIRLFGFSIQPSEIIKPFFAILIAWILTRKKLEQKFPGYIIAFSIMGVIGLLLIQQPDFGMTISLGAIWFTQLVVGGLNIFFIIACFVLGLIGVIMAYSYLDHVKKRIDVFFDSSSGDSYQTTKSIDAFENGGIFGTGPGQGKVKEILPDSHTDFIFSVAGEEFGLIFCLIIISIYAAIILRAYFKIYLDKDIFVLLAVSGLAMQIFFQAAVNMGVAINLLPNTGMTLPFVSYGGSSMISVSLAAGMILAFTRKKYGV
jgi:cell division protein FtsW